MRHKNCSAVCPVVETFRTGKGQRIKEIIEYEGGREVPVVVHTAPIRNKENALDACKEDGSKEAHKITFEVKQDKSNIIFDVCDNGTGIDKETQENIFTLFFSSKGTKGTGLGLFISNKVIKQHGGKIKVKSTLGQGSKFSIKISKIIPESSKTIRNEKK